MNIWTLKDKVWMNQAGDQIRKEEIPDFQGHRNWPGPYQVRDYPKEKNIDLIIKRLWNEVSK